MEARLEVRDIVGQAAIISALVLVLRALSTTWHLAGWLLSRNDKLNGWL
jgi:hypothetical protein